MMDAGRLVQNTAMPLSHQSRHTQLLLAEAIRQLENDAWLDDSAILRQLAAEVTTHDADRGHGAEALILERSHRLADSNPLVGGLLGEIKRIETGARILAIVLAALALIGGVVTASAVLAGSAINIVLAWSALLGVHFLTLVLWGLSLAATAALMAKPSRFADDSLWGRITRRLFAGEQRLVLFRATAALVARGRLSYWVYSLLSHAFWSLFFVSAGVALTYLFALHEYSFKWETTILPASFFVRFVEIFGWLPQQFGLRTPDAAAVISLTDSGAARQAWATWLLAGVVGYGLLPRVLLAGLSLRRCRREAQRLSLDLEQPYYVRLRQRLDALLRPPAMIVDPATGAPTGPHLSPPHPVRHTPPGSNLIFAFELHDDVPWPPGPLPDGVIAYGNLSTADDRDRLLTQLATVRPRRLVAACEARAGLDRGTLYFFEQAARHADQFGALLLNQDAARPGRAGDWREELVELGIDQARIFAATADALRWLEDGHG